MNFALGSSGSVATASSTYSQCCGFTPAAAIDGEHRGLNWANGGGWNGGSNSFPQWLQVDFNASRTIDEVDVYTLQDDYSDPIEPTASTTFSLYGLTGYEVQYWNGSGWVTVPGGSISGNNKVWRKITFVPMTTTKIRLLTNASVDGWTRLPEIEAWGPTVSPRINVALALHGSVATASSTYTQCCGFTPAAAIDGEHRGLNWLNGGGWNSGNNSFPQWLQVDFNASRTIDEVDVYTLQDNYANPIEPTEATTFSLYGLTGYEVQYWNGSGWVNVPGGSISGNNKVWRKITFVPLTTTKIRLLTNASVDGWTRLPEIEAWSAPVAGSAPSDFGMARLHPLNRTGTGGVDLLSNNFNWSLPLVGLPGRNLDLGLTLSYNSLVWTKSGNYIAFDLDGGSIAPGFRLGFPTIEGPYWNNQTGTNFYLLINSTGGRVELRRVGTSNVYESKDSTYLQLVDNLDLTMTLLPPDGSRLNFISVGGGLRCNKMTDRNGNYLNATYKSWGELETVTDTLGRVLTFTYDANWNIQSITQSWDAQTHEWATFGWSTASIGNNFVGLNNLGPNSTSIPVLTQVGLPDGSRYNFEYEPNGYGLVKTISYYAHDPGNPNHERNHTTYVYSASGTDCPRVSQRKDAAEYWTGLNGVPNEVVTQYGHDADGGCRMTLPDGTVHKEFYGSSWQSGLSIETRSYATVADVNSNAWQKRTTTTLTQDNPSVGYLMNPRVVQADVEDISGNHRRTTIDYGATGLGYVQWGLPHIVVEYGVNGATATEFRRSQTDYHLGQAYLDRRLIGQVSSSQLYDAVSAQWLAKTTYSYDTTAIDSQATTATQHEQSYNNLFTTRGNVTAVSRWDVTDINNATKALTSSLTYDAAGSVLTSSDPAGHTARIDYTDSFSADGIDLDSSRPATFAYPTAVKDADWNASTAPNNRSLISYHYEFGTKTRVEGPPPQNQPNGLIQIFNYDGAARVERVTTANNGAFTRYFYGPNFTQSFSSVNTLADEVYAVEIYDGAGRPFAVSRNHPGSEGGFTSVMSRYDQMGRAVQRTNPTEITGQGAPIGDDVTGWQYHHPTEYDWQGRPRKTYSMDGTFKTIDYSGCGCAGGEVITLTDEVGRQQKVYSDVLGRQWKSEVLNWNGSVYSTTTNTFNGRDQVSMVRQWAGAEGSGTYQDTTMSYDGYGRVQSKHVPEQNVGTATVYVYNADDTVQSVTDARGASATYGYNARHLVTSINYTAPQGITPTSNVTFGFDAAGNRTSMNDGLGEQTYIYNQLSRLTSETRGFTGLDDFTLNYDYNLAGQLKRITDPQNSRVDYVFDTAGRLSNITGTNYGVSQFLTSATYRASGAVKQASYGNGRTLSLTYNQRLQVNHLEMPGVMNFDYQFYADGSLKYSHDVIDQRFDRSYEYDHATRLKKGLSGAEARGEAPTEDRPYYQTYTRDAFNHLTNRVTKHWSKNQPYISVDSYTNNRRNGWSYDADGNLTNNLARQYGYDAAGQISFVSGSSLNQYFDGDGRRAKTVEPNLTTYYIRSTVLGGQVVAELDGTGSRSRGFIYQGTRVLAEQWSNGSVVFVFADASGKSIRYTDSQSGGAFIYNELDPVGAEAEREDPYPANPAYTGRGDGGALFPGFGNITQPSEGCTLDGVYALCEWVERGLQNGSVEAQYSVVRPRPSRPPVKPGSKKGTPQQPTVQLTLTTIRVPIISFGLGLYGLEEPTVRINNEGPYLDSEERLFNHTRERGSKECGEHRARLLEDSRIHGMLEAAWERSQFGTPDAHEEGGLIGDVIDHGETYQRDQMVDTRFPRPADTPRYSLGEKFVAWANRETTQNANTIKYLYWYHTHPLRAGQIVQGRKMGDPNHPSMGLDDDVGASQALALRGVMVSETRIVVFGMFGEICSFKRPR